MPYHGQHSFDHGQLPCIGLLLVNLGTPEAPTPRALRRYLAQFLADPRVVELPRLPWRAVLHGVILRTRPRRSAEAYRKIWRETGSPLLTVTRSLAYGLGQELAATLPGPVKVVAAMRYGKPSIAAGLRQLQEAGAWRVLVMPLYPQYAAATTGSVFDALSAELRSWRWVPELRFVGGYHDHPEWVEAIAGSIMVHWEQAGKGERLLFSFHGIPERAWRAGDPYPCLCRKSARLIAGLLGLEEGQWAVAFQSRFGPARWVSPYTDELLRQWAGEGIRRVDVVCPGFAVDCLETLEEIAIRYRDLFLRAGGGELSYIPALNDSHAHVEALAAIARRHCQGWPEADAGYDPARAEEEAGLRQQRMGDGC